MNDLQKTYAVAKAAYDTAFEENNWTLVEELEIPLLEAEAEMVEWALDHAEQSKMIPENLMTILRERWMFPQYHNKMIDLAFTLTV